MTKLTKCLNCGGGLKYSPSKSAVVCEHCDSVFAIPETRRAFKPLRKYSVDFVPQVDESVTNIFICDTCNSVHSVSEGKISTRCPNCGDTKISKTDSRGPSPDGIVPFELEKNQAQEYFEKWLKKRKFAPNNLIKLAQTGKMVKVYVPVFNIFATSVSAYSGMVKKVHTDSSTDTIYSTVHTVQDVSTDNIDGQVLCANKVINSQFIADIVEVDQQKIVPYSNKYLFDYYGAATNLTIHELLDDFKNELAQERENKIRTRLKNKYDEIVHLNCDTQLKNISFNYVYVPVFMNHFKYKDKKYHCYISGTSGKVAGKAPKSAGKIMALVGAILLGIGALALALLKII